MKPANPPSNVRTLALPLLAAAIALLFAGSRASAQTVRFVNKPDRLVHGTLIVPVVANEPVERLELFINGVKYSEAPGRALYSQVRIGEYIRRLRLRAVGYDASGSIAGEDEMVINDPRPPFRVKLSAPAALPESGEVTMSAIIMKPLEAGIAAVDFFIGEEKIATRTSSPYAITFDASRYPGAVYARVVARTTRGDEANDVAFFGSRASDEVDVTLQHVPISVAKGNTALRVEDLTLVDNGVPRKIEALVPASNEPLYVVLLIDYSESMLEELPVVKAAARQFARTLLRPQDRIAVVGFNQTTFWLTGFTNNFEAAAQSVDSVKPIGQTHLYDSAIEMLFELQKMPGRHALVVLTDGVDQGSVFKLDHLVHYARYAGVPVYPVIKNKMLSRLMRFGIGQLEARKLAGIARDTGATYFIIQKERELPGVYQRIAEELRRQYQVVFYSAPGGSDEWHPLRIDTRGGQLLRVPRGYFP